MHEDNKEDIKCMGTPVWLTVEEYKLIEKLRKEKEEQK